MDKKDYNQKEIANFTIILIIGLIIGALLDRVVIGILIGLVLGYVIFGLTKKKKLTKKAKK